MECGLYECLPRVIFTVVIICIIAAVIGGGIYIESVKYAKKNYSSLSTRFSHDSST